MKQKAKGKSRPTSKLKSKHTAKGKLRSNKPASRKPAVKAHNKHTRSKNVVVKPVSRKIVRIMGHGQFVVESKILKELNKIDSALVKLVSNERSDDMEFKKLLLELNGLVMKNGKPLDPREIIKSDIILPSADLSIDEAKRLFQGEGVIPEF